jgi:hypothetical protein
LAIFNALEAGFYRNLLALRNLEAKFLKTANLGGFVRDTGSGRDAAGLRTAHNS